MTWEKKRVLVTVKTYPEKSRKYGTIVCTVGLTEEGEWIRLYPIPLKFYNGKDKIKKFDWIEVECQKNDHEKLGRKESCKVRADSIKIVDRSLSGKPGRRVDWNKRSELLMQHVSPSLEYLQEQYRKDKTSIGMIKPRKVIDFIKNQDLQIYDTPFRCQTALDGSQTPVTEDIPHIFQYLFRCNGCDDDKEHKIQCEDWELLESYRRWGLRYKDTGILWEKLHQKYYTDMIEKKDLYFFMGMYSLQPTWLIIGLYYPPKNGIKVKDDKDKNVDLFKFGD